MDVADDGMYADVLAKFRGDHAQAHMALASIGLAPPTWASGDPAVPSAPPAPPHHHGGFRARGSSELQPASGALGATAATPNPAFVCPLTGIIMRDPAILDDSGVSYERAAIAQLLAQGIRRCPVSGQPLLSGDLRDDEELRSGIAAWATAHAPSLLDADGCLRPAEFPGGVSAAIHEHQALGAHAHSGDFAGRAPAHSTPRPGAYSGPLGAFTGPLSPPVPAPPRPPPDVLQTLPMAPATAPALHIARLQASRRAVRHYRWVSLAANVVFVVGFIVTIGRGGWTVADVSVNPWIGTDAQGMLDAGASCGGCMVARGEWWRLVSALFIVAGVAQALLNGSLLAMAAHIAARVGLPLLGFLAALTSGAVLGALTSAIAAERTVQSTSTALPAAGAAAAAVAAAAVRRYVASPLPSAALLLLWLALLVIASLAPFADTWATLAGAFGGALCSAAVMAPYVLQRRARGSRERIVVAWQAALAAALVATAVALLAALLRMPRLGYGCQACRDVACHDMLGWRCGQALNPAGCDVLVYPNATAQLVCPTDTRVDLGEAPVAAADLDALCRGQCFGAPDAPPTGDAPPATGAPAPGVIVPPSTASAITAPPVAT